jgi:hypothetical protein
MNGENPDSDIPVTVLGVETTELHATVKSRGAVHDSRALLCDDSALCYGNAVDGGFQVVTADPELKTRFEDGKFMKVYEELEALMLPVSPQHIVLDLVARNFQKDIVDDEDKNLRKRCPSFPWIRFSSP